MISLASTDELLNKAFHLASFILGDRNVALRVVMDALAKLEVVTAAQGKRLYYRPKGRPWSRVSDANRFRNNVSLNEPHLLQRLIYIETEPYEIAQERANGSAVAGEDDLVVHFIKHLTRKTMKRNSFYVTLGLSRLLYSYTTAETMDIYNAVIQDPERVKDDYYYRSRKGVLMQELKLRFGDLIDTVRGPRGEQRFAADDNSGRFIALVRECLSLFTPWQTPCLVPVGIDPITDGIPSLSYQGHDDEDKVEVNRMHAVLHPDCFARLTSDLHFDAPETRLEIPRFFYTTDTNGNRSNGHSHHQPTLTEQELLSIEEELESDSVRRKTARAGTLRIVVDGVEHARIDLRETCGKQFRVSKDAELIEIHSQDNAGKELLLASHLVTAAKTDDVVGASNTSIMLEGGQNVAIVVSKPVSGESGSVVAISYRETNPFRAGSLWFHQFTHSLSSTPARIVWKDRRVFVPMLAVVLLIISFGLVVKYNQRNGRTGEQHQVLATQQNNRMSEENRASTNAVSDHGATSTPSESRTSKSSTTPPAKGSKMREQSGRVAPSLETESTARNSGEARTAVPTTPESETRSIKAARASTPLSAVKQIYVETSGDKTLAQNVQQLLRDRLRAGDLIFTAQNRDDADGLLEVTVAGTESDKTGTVKIQVELINGRGEVIWTKAGGYQGSSTDVSASLARDLLRSIKKSKRRQ